ncbi:hypothetical protein Sd1012_0480 [Shigella dysenteriae 1012]|nr:hypothetical protein Sd1012_0480 [Shigella dysenteriae 1012]
MSDGIHAAVSTSSRRGRSSIFTRRSLRFVAPGATGSLESA